MAVAAATTVRVERDVKAELDRLLGTVQARTGSRPSQSELLRMLLRFARRDEAGFLEDEAGVPWRPPTMAQMERFIGAVDGPRTDASRVDEYLYGRRRRT